MFSNSGAAFVPSETDKKGAFLIDRSPSYFKAILNYLRTDEINLDSNISPSGNINCFFLFLFLLF